MALGDPVTADSDDEHYVIASDLHWGSPFASLSKSVQFLEEEVPALDPDVLVLAGDIYEMWWRGMVSSALDVGRASARVAEIHESGTDVALVAGNHDRWMLRVGEDASELIAPGEPWEITEEFYFESGGQEFVAVHGDEGDPLQRDPLSEWLCRQTDEFGTFLLELLNLISGLGTVGEVGTTAARGGDWQSVSLAHQYDDPVIVPGPLERNAAARPRVRTQTRQIGTDSVELRLDSSTRAPTVPEAVDYVAFERGHHVFGTDATATVDRVPADGDWRSVTFTAPFERPPAVFAAIQRTATSTPPALEPAQTEPGRHRARAYAERPTVDAEMPVGDRGSFDPDDPVAVQVRNVTQMGFEMRLAAEREPVAHDVGFVAIERGTATLGDGLVEVGVPGSTDGEALSVEFERLPGEPDQVFAGPQTATTDGPTLTRLEGRGRDGVSVSVVAGGGRPVSETVGYLATEGVGSIPASASTALEDDPDAVLKQEWETLLDSGPVLSPEDAPGDVPTAGLLDPQFVSTQNTTESLLDMFEEFVVFGHTHRPDLGERHVNSGSWTSRSPDSVPQNTYVEIDQGDITVWDWSPEGREPVFES